MASISIRFEYNDVERLSRVFPLAADVAEDLTPVWNNVADNIGAGIEETFDAEGTSTHGQWPELSEWTAAERVYKGYPPYHPILEQSGTLKMSLTQRQHPMHFEQITPDELVYGTFVPYALIHERGGVNEGGYFVPQRKIIDAALLNRKISRAFEDAASVEFRRAFRGA